MTQKQPQAGEWWTCKGTRVRVVGLHSGGDYVCELEAGDLTILPLGRAWRHLPDCTGWDWRPEVWPKWYVPKQIYHMSGYGKIVAYYRRDAKNSGITVHTDGSHFTWEDWDNGHMKIEVTEAEALARVKPAETFPQYWTAINDELYAYCQRFEPNKYRMVKRDGTVMPDSPWHPDSGQDRTRLTKDQAEALLDNPQESPDDWVTQDLVPDRPEIDQWRRVFPNGDSSPWEKSIYGQLKYMHGDVSSDTKAVFEVRCRRKDLTPLPSPKRVSVRLVCSTEDIGSVNWRMHDDPGIAGETEIHHDGYKFYVEVQQ